MFLATEAKGQWGVGVVWWGGVGGIEGKGEKGAEGGGRLSNSAGGRGRSGVKAL